VFQRAHCCFTSHGGEIVEEFVQTLPTLQIVQQSLEGTRVPRKTGVPPRISGSFVMTSWLWFGMPLPSQTVLSLFQSRDSNQSVSRPHWVQHTLDSSSVNLSHLPTAPLSNHTVILNEVKDLCTFLPGANEVPARRITRAAWSASDGPSPRAYRRAPPSRKKTREGQGTRFCV